MAVTKQPLPQKIIREYKDDNGKLESRWYYDLEKFKYGPILVEEFNLPKKEKKSKKVA